MPLFDRPPIDAISVSDALFSSGTFRITGGPGIIVGSDASGATISATDTAPAVSYYDNMVPNGSISPLASLAVSYNSLIIAPLDPSNEKFIGNMTVSTMMMQFSMSMASSSSSAFSSSVDLGIYSRVNGTQLSIINSVRSSWTKAATSNQSNSYHGLRWLTIASSQFSVSPVFSAGRYYVALLIRSSSNSNSATMLGQIHMGSNLRSGTMGASATTGNTGMGVFPLMGLLSVTTASLPGSIAASAVNQATAGAGFIPGLVFNNLTSSF
jgi:hypothetical protein